MTHHLFLIPGYLGYRGKEGYWGFWDAVLPLLREQGFVCYPVDTDPIGAIERRSERLRDAILRSLRETTLAPEDRISLLGFSAGGLDARYLLSPATPVALPDDVRQRIRVLATLATPHYGTPLADFYRSWRADDLLGFFAGVFAKWNVADRLADLAGIVRRYDAVIRKTLPEPQARDFLRLVEGLALATPEEREGVRDFLSSLATSRGALKQLCVRRMRTFNRLVTNATDVRYLCYLTGAEPVKPTNFGTALYALGCFLASRWPIPEPPRPYDGALPAETVVPPDGKPLPSDGATTVLPRGLSDSIVPTASQLWGEYRAYAPIDHHAAYGRPFDLMRVPEFAGEGLRALYHRIGADLLEN